MQASQTPTETLNNPPGDVFLSDSGNADESVCRIRQFTSSDGYRHKFRHWAAENCKSVVVALHGIQSHSDWYRYSSAHLACHGCDVYFADRRGSGLNGNQRGHADDAARLLHDVRQLIRIARSEHPHAEITLLGLSWGGKLAAAFAACLQQDINRLALLYPGLKSRFAPTRFQSALLNFAVKRDWKTRLVRIPFDSPDLFTCQPKWQNFIQDDPLKLEWITTGLVHAGQQLDHMLAESNGVSIPTLLCLAGQDRIIDNQQTRKIVSEWPTSSLKIRCFPDAQHTLEFETERDEFVEQLSMFCLGLS